MHSFSNFSESNWISTYRESNQLWFLDSLNWEKTSSFSFSDYSLSFFLNNSFFVSQHVLTDKFTKLSYLDIILVKSNSWGSDSSYLYFSFLNDLYVEFFNSFFLLISFFGSNYQDVYSLIFSLNPEINIAFSDYFSEFFFFTNLNLFAVSVFDSFLNNLNFFSTDGLFIFAMFFLNIYFLIYFIMLNLSLRWSSLNFSHFARFFHQVYSLSVESRIQFEASVQIFIVFAFYWIAALLTFDDDYEEFIEFFDVFYFYFFTTIIVYFVTRHFIHYLSFIEASVATGRNTNYLILQFRNDILGSLSLLLRFYTLLFRVNVYDTLEDFFDSYYIFLGDFDDDEYLNELFTSLNGVLSFTADNNDDRSFIYEDENDFFNDFFYLYFLIWGKFFYFFLLMIELSARFGLAFYILYLVVFEVHSVNCSYIEDKFFYKKKWHYYFW